MANSNIPLVRSNSVDDINTSIIAIKKELKTNGETDINVNVDVNYPENAYPVDAVTDGDMHSVTSNAVFDAIADNQPKYNGSNMFTVPTFPFTAPKNCVVYLQLFFNDTHHECNIAVNNFNLIRYRDYSSTSAINVHTIPVILKEGDVLSVSDNEYITAHSSVYVCY